MRLFRIHHVASMCVCVYSEKFATKETMKKFKCNNNKKQQQEHKYVCQNKYIFAVRFSCKHAHTYKVMLAASQKAFNCNLHLQNVSTMQ